MLYHILYIFNQKTHAVFTFHIMSDSFDTFLIDTVFRFDYLIGFLDSNYNLAAVKIGSTAITFDYFHN